MTKPEDAYLIHQLVRKYRPKGRTLLVGSKLYANSIDRRDWYKDCIGLDMQQGEGVDIVHDLENPLDGVGVFDHIDCCSVLEHVKRPWKMAANIERLLKPKGTLIVSAPFVWRVHGYPSDYWRITERALKILFPCIQWKETGYVVDGRLVDRSPSWRQDGRVVFERSEVAGFGVKKA